MGDFSAFVALFPNLVAGPIIRYKTLSAQLTVRDHTWERFAAGVAIFVLGFAKKILLANPAGNVADTVFNAAAPGMGDAWFGALAYAFQIYFDFCGYSDMAVGLGRMLGFDFLKNFDAPYRSQSITELWQRWHISLSSVLRDYLYFPLGGNRLGVRRTYINLVIVMLLGGLWHGAKWNFIAWGTYHGGLLVWERWRGKTSLYSRWPPVARVGCTFLLMLFSWVLFRADNLTLAGRYFGAMFGWVEAGPEAALLGAVLYAPLSCLVMALSRRPGAAAAQAHATGATAADLGRVAFLIPLFLVAVATMYAQAFNPFLYFQF